MSLVSKLQFTHASRSSHSWLSRQPQLVQSSKLLVASLSCPELGTAQPQLVFSFCQIGILYLRHILGKSKAYLRQILGISLANLRHILDKSQANLRYISEISKAYIMHISSIYHAYLWFISGISQTNLRHILGKCHAYLNSKRNRHFRPKFGLKPKPY